MIIQSDGTLDLSQYVRINGLLMRKDMLSAPTGSAILQRRPRQGPRLISPGRRANRNNFFKQIAGIWRNRTPNAAGAFTALAATLSPWETWEGAAITLTAYKAYQIFMTRFFELYLLSVLEPLDVDLAFSPWPSDWPAPIGWGIPTINYTFTPPRIQWPYSAPADIFRVCLLTVYLADPHEKTTLDPFRTSYRVWTNNAPLLSRTATLYTWEFPTEKLSYPYNLPSTQTRCAIRPNDGSYFSPQKGSRVLLPFNTNVQRFYLDKPAP